MTYFLAFPLLATGNALAHGRAGLSQGLSPKGLLKDLSFGLQLQQKLDQLGTDGSDLLSQLAGMLQAGTPLATIIDRVSKAVAQALASATGNSGDTTRRRTLERALASALAPPGTSPPGQSPLRQAQRYDEAVALEQRLTNLLSKISGELKNAGQQSRFSGAVLDADTAREIPAQQQNKQSTGTTQQPAAPLALAESILRNVLQQLQQDASQTPQPTQSSAQPASQQITVQSADVLGRMLARAANAQAQSAQQPTAPAANAVSAHTATATSPAPSASPSDIFARLMHVIAQSAGDHASGQGGQGNKQSQEFAFSKNALPAVHLSQTANTTIAAPAFTAAIANASAPAAQPLSPAMQPYVDPQAIIEQVVKGIVVSNAGGTSSLSMRLQPEHLGDVALKLTVTGNTISANIVAQNADVRHALLQNQGQLARSLAEAGLSLGKFSVDVSGGNPGFSQQQQQHRSFARTGSVHLTNVAEDDMWADSRFGPPVLAGSKPLVLNYLA